MQGSGEPFGRMRARALAVVMHEHNRDFEFLREVAWDSIPSRMQIESE